MTDSNLTDGGYSIFHETMADMTYPELERAAREGAIALWGLGVIEEHGPHLPLGTDVYVPYAKLKRVRRLLDTRGVKAVIVPPFYWGVNHVTGGFTGSIQIRPETMVDLMLDVFRSLAKDGFRAVFCLSGHGDALHNKTIADGIKRGRGETGIDAYVVLGAALAQRLGLDAGDPQFITVAIEAPRGKHMDVHAGDWETSLIWGVYPDLVRREIIPTLKSTDFGPADLAEWRRGGEIALRKTPLGYLGDPASADPARGRTSLDREAMAITDAISRKLSTG